jgi:hypothetical protein
VTTADRIAKLSDAFGKRLDRQKQLKADVEELEAIAQSLTITLTRGVGNHAALDAWEMYKERKQRK